MKRNSMKSQNLMKKAPDYQKAKKLLLALKIKASEAIQAIDTNAPDWKLCNLAIEDIDELTSQIQSAIFGKYLLSENNNLNNSN